MVKKESKKFKLNKEDGTKILKGFAIAAGGTVLTYALELIPMIDWNGYDMAVIPIACALVNAGLKVLQGK